MGKKKIFLAILTIIMIVGTVIFKNCNGTMKDPRDGKTYRTVKIGDQVWMAENLNFDYSHDQRPLPDMNKKDALSIRCIKD